MSGNQAEQNFRGQYLKPNGDLLAMAKGKRLFFKTTVSTMSTATASGRLEVWVTAEIKQVKGKTATICKSAIRHKFADTTVQEELDARAPRVRLPVIMRLRTKTMDLVKDGPWAIVNATENEVGDETKQEQLDEIFGLVAGIETEESENVGVALLDGPESEAREELLEIFKASADQQEFKE